jgi:hypothetical protein
LPYSKAKQILQITAKKKQFEKKLLKVEDDEIIELNISPAI